MDIFSLSAKIKLDTTDFTEGVKKVGEKIGDLAGHVGNGIKKVGKFSTAAVGAGAVAVGGLVKQAVDAYGRYEQLVGGVETLFKGASDTVMENAKKAYATAGMSANEYMETATSFAASLIQSTGRGVQQDVDALTEALDEEYLETKRTLEDEYEEIKSSWDDRIKLAKASGTENVDLLKAQKGEELKALKRSNQDQLKELKNLHKEQIAAAEEANSTSVTTEESLQRAAELADVAMRDISDNVNKMGTTQESIRFAYAGFAKQNFTMLDNLKLGYGGTKKEMERLLKDAQKISGIKYDVSSYADIVAAIHVIQEEIGITGTTAEEAEHTIEGSISATRAAWENLITGLGDKNADLSELVNNVIDNGTKAAGNLAPVVGAAVDGIITVVTEKAPEIIGDAEKGTGLAGAIKNGLPKITTAASSLVSAFTSQLPGILTAVIDIAPDVLKAVGEIFGDIVKAIPELMNTVTEKLKGDNGEIAKMIGDAADFIFEQAPVIWEAGLNLFSELLHKAPEIVSNITSKLPQLIKDIIGKPGENGKEGSGLLGHLPEMWDAGVELFKALIKDVPAIVNAMAKGLGDLVGQIADKLASGELLDEIAEIGIAWGKALVNSMFGILDGVDNLVKNVATSIWNAITGQGTEDDLFKRMKEAGKMKEAGASEEEILNYLSTGDRSISEKYAGTTGEEVTGSGRTIYDYTPEGYIPHKVQGDDTFVSGYTVNVYGVPGDDLADAITRQIYKGGVSTQ